MKIYFGLAAEKYFVKKCSSKMPFSRQSAIKLPRTFKKKGFVTVCDLALGLGTPSRRRGQPKQAEPTTARTAQRHSRVLSFPQG